MAEPSVSDFDPTTGRATTGHEWDGIKELNTPLPRWWLWTLYGTIAFALLWMVLYPAVPLINSATRGALGYTTRGEVEDSIASAKAAQAGNLEQVTKLSADEIAADPDLLRFAVAGGRSASLVNCVQCHGSGAAGSPGYPNLNDDDWLWGGTLADIQASITHGIRYAQDPETRTSAMPAFGSDGILDHAQITAVAEHVLSLSGAEYDAKLAESGKTVFADNCAACHSDNGGGNRELGAPALNDAISLYGSDRKRIVAQITRPRHGVMPAWVARLDPTTIKQLTLYVHSLGGGEAALAAAQ